MNQEKDRVLCCDSAGTLIKLRYEEPRLVLLGDVRDLTLGGSPANPEESNATIARRN